MKHMVAGGLILAAIVGGVLLWGGGSGGDLLAERDRFFREGPLVVEFAQHMPGQQPDDVGYALLTYLGDDAWIDSGIDGRRIHTRDGYFRWLDDRCYLASDTVVPPLVPGIAIARSLLSRVELEHDEAAQTYTYSIPREYPFTVLVVEDLSRLRDEDIVSAYSRSAARGGMNGTFTIRRPTPEELAAAQAEIADAQVSPVARMSVSWRFLRPADEPDAYASNFLVARDCPDTVSFDSGIGAYFPALAFNGDGTASMLDVVPVDLPLDAEEQALIDAAAEGEPGSVPLRVGQVVVATWGDPTTDVTPWTAYEIVSCEPVAWLDCGALESVGFRHRGKVRGLAP